MDEDNRFSTQIVSGVTIQMFDKLRTKVDELAFNLREMIDQLDQVK